MREVEGEVATYTLRSQEFQVSSPVWECPDTGERYFTPEQGNVFLDRLHRAWREHHGLSKEALRQHRKALKFSRNKAADFTGLRPSRYRRYEKTDRLPSEADAELLCRLVAAASLAARPMPTTTPLMQPASNPEAEAVLLPDNLGELLRRAPGRPLPPSHRSAARVTVLSVAGLDSFPPQLLVKAGRQSWPQPVAVQA